jgi:hypothetical protein
MNRTIVAGISIVALAALALSDRPTAADPVPDPTSPAWEYACIQRPIDQLNPETHTTFLNEHGAQGWELCDQLRQGQNTLCVFRRPQK